jgi:NAD-dependent SIR2 family protein deacetylase
MKQEFKRVLKYSFKNKDSIEKSINCSCYYCISSFLKEEIQNWTDQGQTAICPKCGIDSVLGDIVLPFEETTFKKLKEYWF